MARETYVIRGGQLVPKHLAPPLHATHGRGPNIIRDGVDPFISQADGKPYDSKSAYYGSLKDHGCEIVGNDRAWIEAQPKFEPAPVAPDIKRALEELRSR